MRKIVVTEWISLDGYTSGPNNDMSFIGEWFDEQMGQYEGTIVDTADTLILGRVTYESFAASWPHVPDSPTAAEPEKEYARKLNAMNKIVYSRTLASADWSGSTLRREIDVAELADVKRQDGKDLLIYGSASVIRELTRLELIDEYQLLVFPVLLGGGLRLFDGVEGKHKLKLVSSTPFTSGVVLMTYQRQ